MTKKYQTAEDYISAIKDSQKKITEYDKELLVPGRLLEELFKSHFIGLSTPDAPRTRKKFIKSSICKLLGYPEQKSFNRGKLQGQDLDAYVGDVSNIQIWSPSEDKFLPSVRYAIMPVNDAGLIDDVVIIRGDALKSFDNTEALTSKFQARCPSPSSGVSVHFSDTHKIKSLIKAGDKNLRYLSPITPPSTDTLMSIEDIAQRLEQLVGISFLNPGGKQDRGRGTKLHELVCQCLGYADFRDNGQCPDILNQMCEIKLQTSPTIDLGSHLPCSEKVVPKIESINGYQPQYSDIRYIIAHAEIIEGKVCINGFDVVSGENFFTVCKQFGGNEINSKVQIRLPSDWKSNPEYLAD